jgi:hypothetical protein
VARLGDRYFAHTSTILRSASGDWSERYATRHSVSKLVHF